MVMKTKSFESALLKAAVPPDTTSLDEQVTAFLATLDSKNVLDVKITSHTGGRYGLTTNHFATVLYRE